MRQSEYSAPQNVLVTIWGAHLSLSEAAMTAELLMTLTLATAMAAGLRATTRIAPATGEAVYGKYCASCHDQLGARIPNRDALKAMSPGRILKALDFGPMMSIAYPLRRDEREAVARFLGQGADDPPPPASAFCRPDR